MKLMKDLRAQKESNYQPNLSMTPQANNLMLSQNKYPEKSLKKRKNNGLKLVDGDIKQIELTLMITLRKVIWNVCSMRVMSKSTQKIIMQ